MNYREIAWAALIDYYVSGEPNRYVEFFKNGQLIDNLRKTPSLVPFEDFKDQVIFFLNAWGRMFFDNTCAKEIYEAIVRLHNSTSQLQGDTLMACDLSSGSTVCQVTEQMYGELTTIWGVNMTGFSKIAHIMNDSLFPLIDNPIREKYRKTCGISLDAKGYISWMRAMQKQAGEVVKDFREQDFPGSPEVFLSQTLGYAAKGCTKSLAKFIDEYYWLTVTRGTPIPPKWIPA